MLPKGGVARCAPLEQIWVSEVFVPNISWIAIEENG